MNTFGKILASSVAVLATSHAFACSGFISNLVGNCDLDRLSDAVQQVVPGSAAVLNPNIGTIFPAPVVFPPLPRIDLPQAPAPAFGSMCATPTGMHPMGFASPAGTQCSGVNQWGVFEVGVVR